MTRTGLVAFALFVCSAGAAAQAQEEQQGEPPAQAEPLPPGHPPLPSQVANSGISQALREPMPAMAQPSADVPAGTIRVLVVDPRDRPIRNSPVELGVMVATGDRSRRYESTDADGVAHFRDLPTGTDQAYRVNVRYRGATYSSTPFRLEDDRGYLVRVVRLPVTRDDRMVFFNVYRIIVELVEERMHVIHQVEITNAGSETYVFPRRGVRGALPHGSLAFQTQEVMTDQRVEELSGQDKFTIKGSLPPGTVRLAWAYDVPVDDDPLEIPIAIPMRFFSLEVYAEAAENLRMNVDGLPRPRELDNEGQAYWGTGIQRRPTDARMSSITIVLEDIPGPGPLRWFAAIIALLVIGGGVALALARRDNRAALKRARQRRREALLAEARVIEDEHAAGEIGPEFRQKRREAIVRELAVLLHEDEAASQEARAVIGAR